MLYAALIQIAEMRIQSIIVERYIYVGIARRQPGLLNAHRAVVFIHWQLALLRLKHPVIAVVGDGAYQLFAGNNLYREREIADEPILGSNWPRGNARIVFIIVPDTQGVRRSCYRGVVEFRIVRGHADVELHPTGMQVR